MQALPIYRNDLLNSDLYDFERLAPDPIPGGREERVPAIEPRRIFQVGMKEQTKTQEKRPQIAPIQVIKHRSSRSFDWIRPHPKQSPISIKKSDISEPQIVPTTYTGHLEHWQDPKVSPLSPPTSPHLKNSLSFRESNHVRNRTQGDISAVVLPLSNTVGASVTEPVEWLKATNGVHSESRPSEIIKENPDPRSMRLLNEPKNEDNAEFQMEVAITKLEVVPYQVICQIECEVILKTQTGYSYMACRVGEVRRSHKYSSRDHELIVRKVLEVLGEGGNLLWLARNPKDLGQIGWVWADHFTRFEEIGYSAEDTCGIIKILGSISPIGHRPETQVG